MQRQLDDAAEGLGCLIVALAATGALAVITLIALLIMKWMT